MQSAPVRFWLTAVLLSGLAVAQPVLRLKTRSVSTNPAARVSEPASSLSRHFLIQFAEPPSAAAISSLKQRGVAILAGVPQNGLLVSMHGRVSLGGLGIDYAEPVFPADKISPVLTNALTHGDPAAASGFLLVEFYSDVDMNLARAMILGLGFALQENPDLASNQLMIHPPNPAAVIAKLAQQDPVSYIFPASPDLAGGVPVRPCEGALSTNGIAPQSIPAYGEGWDGPGLGPANVHYFFDGMTAQVSAASAQSEIERAMAQWAKAVQVTWLPGTSPAASATVNILWAAYSHGDGFPFDGPGGVVAHTFYPAPPNPEPIAGDMHFDESESWHIGANTDVFSVALHELGHALGLGHSDNPADVMYPYYKMVTGLNAGDIAAIQTLYAAQAPPAAPPTLPSAPSPPSGSSPNPNPNPNPSPSPGSGSGTGAPPSITIVSPASSSVSTGASSIAINGTAGSGAGIKSVTWADSFGLSGTAAGTVQWSLTAPLLVGSNTIVIKVVDAGGNSSWRSIVVSRN